MKKLFVILLKLVIWGAIGWFLYRTYLFLSPLQKSEFDWTYGVLLGLFLVAFIYYNYKFHKSLFAWQKRRREYREKVQSQKRFCERFLKETFQKYSLEELKTRIKEIEEYPFVKEVREYRDEVDEKLTEARRVLEEKQHKEEISKMKEEKDQLQEEIQELRHEKIIESNDEKARKREIKGLLDFRNKVFLKEELDDDKTEIILEEGYEQANEYDVVKKRIMPVLVKKIMNHSRTHTFLVWSVMQLLDEMKEVDDVEEHETKDADITFKYKGKTYALEVETGTLLEKKKQTKAKISYLNYKYPERWMFIVSNKNLLPIYRTLGLATSRNGVAKKLEKMLKNSTRN